MDSLSQVLAAGMLFFEMTSVRLPVLGLFSAGAACSLALAIHGGSALGAGVGAGVLLLRTAVKGQVRSLPIDLIPLWAACLVARWPLAVPCVYVAVQAGLIRHMSPSPAWLRLQAVVGEMRLLVVLAALGLAQLPPDQPLLGLLGLSLWGTHRAVAYSIFRLHSKDADEALDSVDQLERDMEKLRLQANSARRRLRISSADHHLIEEMSMHLTGAPDSTRALDVVLEAAASLGNYTSVGIFHGSEPLRYRGPHTTRLDDAPLLQLREPLVESAASHRSVQILRSEEPNRIFQGELAAVAVPLGDKGVLYVGRPGPELTLDEHQSLLSLALRAGPLLDAARLRFMENRQLQRTQIESHALAGQVTLLHQLLTCSQQLFSALEGEQLLEICDDALSQLIPHQQGQIWLKPEAPSHHWGGPVQAEIGALVSRVVQSEVPLILPRLSDGRCFLSAPFPRQTLPGAVVLIHQQGDSFQRDHQDLLLGFVQQLGLALANARYLKQVIETQSQLVQSSKMTAVGQLAAGVAHELNTPLGAIALSLEAASLGVESPNILKKLQRASVSTERCRQIVQKLMIYTSLSLDTKEPVDLAELVRDTLDFFKTQLELEGIQLQVSLQEGVIVQGVAQELQQVLVSLLLNAKESQTRSLLISCAPTWIQVRDAGIGIPEENLARVFEPFFTNKKIGENVGLGLSVAREIVQKHGGKLTLQSQLGKGTIATISFG